MVQLHALLRANDFLAKHRWGKTHRSRHLGLRCPAKPFLEAELHASALSWLNCVGCLLQKTPPPPTHPPPTHTSTHPHLHSHPRSAAIPSLKPLFRTPRSKLVRYLLRAPWEQEA